MQNNSDVITVMQAGFIGTWGEWYFTDHHNDCFLASATDFGTYTNVDEDKAYLGQETMFVAMGGETCAVSEYTACPNALNDLSNLHFSYLNIDYNADVLNQWRTEGCFNQVEKSLGYRLRLIEGTLTNLTASGNTLSMQLPNGYETLESHSVYSVRFANQDIWDADAGENQLSQSIRIDNRVATDAYVGSLFFALDNWRLKNILPE